MSTSKGAPYADPWDHGLPGLAGLALEAPPDAGIGPIPPSLGAPPWLAPPPGPPPTALAPPPGPPKGVPGHPVSGHGPGNPAAIPGAGQAIAPDSPVPAPSVTPGAHMPLAEAYVAGLGPARAQEAAVHPDQGMGPVPAALDDAAWACQVPGMGHGPENPVAEPGWLALQAAAAPGDGYPWLSSHLSSLASATRPQEGAPALPGISEAPGLDPTGISTAALLQPLLPLLGVGPGLSGSPSGEAQKASYSPSLSQEPGAIPPYQAGVPSGDPIQGPCTAAGMEGLALGDLPGIGPIPDASEPQGLGFLVPGADGRPAGPGPGGPILVQEPSAPGAFEIPGIPGIPAIGYPELEGYLAGLAGIAGAPAALPEAPAAQAAPPGAPPEAGAASHSPSLEQEPGGLVPAKPPEGAGKRHWAEGPLPYVGAVPVTKARADFPILSEKVENGREVVWFDNAATTQKPRQVIERLAYFYEHENSNVHRGAHALAARATDAYEAARERVARYLGAKGRDNIVFVRGTTEAINLVAHSYVLPRLSPGDEIIITGLEHHANVVPWQVVAAKSGALLKVAPIDSKGQLIPEAYLSLFGPRTRFVSVTHVSNALGTVNPVASLVAAAHAHGVPILIDGAQSVSHIPVNVTALGADFFVFSGHKIYGPTGIGALYGTDEALQDAEPYQVGGNMIADVTYGKTVYHGPPQKFEAGTGNIADAVGLGAALDYVSDLGLHNIEAYESAILDYATTLVSKLPRVRIIGTAAHKASVLSFVVEGLDTLEVGARLSSAGIAVRAGHHCSQPTVRHFGLEGTVRASLAFYNTAEEVEYFHSVLKGIAS